MIDSRSHFLLPHSKHSFPPPSPSHTLSPITTHSRTLALSLSLTHSHFHPHGHSLTLVARTLPSLILLFSVPLSLKTHSVCHPLTYRLTLAYSNTFAQTHSGARPLEHSHGNFLSHLLELLRVPRLFGFHFSTEKKKKVLRVNSESLSSKPHLHVQHFKHEARMCARTLRPVTVVDTNTLPGGHVS